MTDKKTNKKAEDLDLDLLNVSGKKVGSVKLSGDVFAQTVYKDLVQQAVRWQRAKKRAGTHQALTRTMMIGGQKKPFKQKHTGNARAGSSVSPLWVGGASIHGPLPRDYEFSLPKKVKRKALASVLSDKVKKQSLIVVDQLQVASGKTKEMLGVLGNLGVATKKVVIVVKGNQQSADQSVLRASRNLPRVKTLQVAGVNVYDLVNADVVVGDQSAITELQNRLTASGKEVN